MAKGDSARMFRRMQLEDKTALITGGGSGIGEAIAWLFAREGAAVAVGDIAANRAERVTSSLVGSGMRAISVVFDVADENAVANAVSRVVNSFGPVDILVNNAGVSLGDDITTIPPEIWDRNLGIVLRGPYLCARAVLPSMIERGSGVILNIASVNGMTGLGEEAYSAAKAGLLNLTQNMAVRYGQFGIRANAISPGTIRTPIWNERLKEAPDVFESLSAWYPLGRVGEAGDVANAALFLVSDASSFITGVNLPVDGGLTAGSYGMTKNLQGE
jgi:NAD(P)-dependent dehydrogenase (short-subunit alcohol dehydrogenase family)